MSEWKPLNGIVAVSEAVAAGMEIQEWKAVEDWIPWGGKHWDKKKKYCARPRKPTEQEQDWIDRLAGQYGVKQAATLRGDVQAMRTADIWLLDIASKHWHEIISALRKEQESAKQPAKVQVEALKSRYSRS